MCYCVCECVLLCACTPTFVSSDDSLMLSCKCIIPNWLHLWFSFPVLFSSSSACSLTIFLSRVTDECDSCSLVSVGALFSRSCFSSHLSCIPLCPWLTIYFSSDMSDFPLELWFVPWISAQVRVLGFDASKWVEETTLSTLGFGWWFKWCVFHQCLLQQYCFSLLYFH